MTEAFTATLAANPYVLAAAGIVAVTAAAVTLTGVLITQSDEYEGMTATCRDQYDELQRLNDQYNAACEQYGENSDAANSLRYQLDQLNDEFEANRQTVKEFVAECDGLVESHNQGHGRLQQLHLEHQGPRARHTGSDPAARGAGLAEHADHRELHGDESHHRPSSTPTSRVSV